jgi:hypothetical protein
LGEDTHFFYILQNKTPFFLQNGEFNELNQCRNGSANNATKAPREGAKALSF